MGREIRRVPPNWDHPKHPVKGYLQPMSDETYEQASAKWIQGFIEWHIEKKYPEGIKEERKLLAYWDWHGPPPDEEYYRPWKDEEATWYQVWETESEGTPVTPPFATMDELIQHLAEYGDDCGDKPWGMERAKAFCETGWACSLVMIGGKVFDGTDTAAIQKAMEADGK